jgi:hypothetical protein
MEYFAFGYLSFALFQVVLVFRAFGNMEEFELLVLRSWVSLLERLVELLAVLPEILDVRLLFELIGLQFSLVQPFLVFGAFQLIIGWRAFEWTQISYFSRLW